MPRNVRNFWLELDVDGSKKQIATGPVRADGGFDLTIKMRHNGEVTHACDIIGRANAAGEITLRIRPQGADADTVICRQR